MDQMPAAHAIGMAWYRKDAYAACMSIFEDADNLPGTYEEWLVLAEQAEQRESGKGVAVLRVEIDPVEFPRWCAANGYPNIDRHARMAFASEGAMRWLRDRS